MGRVFHIGKHENGGFELSGVSQTAPELSAGPSSMLKSQFGTGYDESAVRNDAMTHFPVPGNNNGLTR